MTIAFKSLADPGKAVNDEYYEIETSPERITIAAATPHGAFNGTRTLMAMLDDTRSIPEATITDWPDLDYRGMMLDVARNFTTADNLKKLMHALASYKINVLHLHFIDDEGWRIEIPGLEELTEARQPPRPHRRTNPTACIPQYDGNFDPQASTSGNGYYTREEFIDLLRYADARHIRVIPEVEMPGHARAAIKAMNTRHARYRDSDPIKASEYLLADFDDESKYLSAQWYSDNALNPAMPSTYRFIDKVIGEIAAMYSEAGAPLLSIHLGGDEVAHGAWTASPTVKEFMDKNGMTEIRQVAEHFITEASAILEKYGLKFGAWQEAAIGHSLEGDKILAPRAEGIYCWNTVPEWDGDRIPYTIANNGYPVILCNVNNFYLDLAYDPHPAEPGLNWAGYINETQSLSMLPYDVYRSAAPTCRAIREPRQRRPRQARAYNQEPRQHTRCTGSALERDNPRVRHGAVLHVPQDTRSGRTRMERSSDMGDNARSRERQRLQPGSGNVLRQDRLARNAPLEPLGHQLPPALSRSRR